MVKSGLEKNIWNSYLRKPSFYFKEMKHFLQNCKFSNKNDHLSAWRDFTKQTNVSFEAFLVGNQEWRIKGQMLRYLVNILSQKIERTLIECRVYSLQWLSNWSSEIFIFQVYRHSKWRIALIASLSVILSSTATSTEKQGRILLGHQTSKGK